MRKLLCFCIFSLSLSSSVQAQIVAFDFQNNTVDGSVLDLSPSFVNLDVTSTPVTSPGFDFSTTSASAFTSENLGLMDGLADAVGAAFTNNEFFEFTVTANAGNTLFLDALNFDVGRAANGAQDFAIRSSVDGFAANLFPISNQAIGTVLSAQSFDLNSLANAADFDGLSTITFQIAVDDRFSNTSGASGTFIDNLELEGSVVADTPVVPEPSSLAIVGFGLAGLFARRRRS